MSLHSIVDYVNTKLKEYPEIMEEGDAFLAYATNSVGESITTEMSEVLYSYRHSPPKTIALEHLIVEIERREEILYMIKEILIEYKEILT